MSPRPGHGGREKPPLSVAPSEWVGGRFRAPAFITGEGPAYRPDVVLWLELGRQHLHAAKLVRPNEPNAVIVASLDEALAAAGSRQRPGCVRVADPATGELLRAHLGSSLEVRVAPTPEIEPVLEDMARHMGRGSGSYLAGGATPEQVARLFAAAARLYRVAPWRIVGDDDQLIGVEAPALGLRRGCVSIIGVVGEEEGFLLFQSIADFGRFVEAGERNERGERPKHLGFTLTSLTFVRGSELPAEARREIARHGWEVSDVHSYPWLQVVEPDFVERPPTVKDIQLATALAESLSRFMDAHRALFAEPAPVLESERYVLDEVAEGVAVVVTAPHPEAPWDREPTAAEAELRRHLEDEEAEAKKLVDGFAAALVAGGADERRTAAGRVAALSLFHFKIYEHDAHLDGLTAEAVERYLLDWVPERLSGTDELYALVPELLAELASWLAREGRLAPGKAVTIAKRVEKVRERFLRAVADPARWSPAKRLLVDAERAGVDVSDPAAVQRFVSERGRRRSRAWSSGASAAPDEPCPCGSGRKFKNCCGVR